jgi:F0F1-type ATP synthase gamma subunit
MDTLEKCKTIELRWLKNMGLLGTYNSNIVKLLLGSNHDIVDKKAVDHTTKGDKIDGVGGGVNMSNFFNMQQDELEKLITNLAKGISGPSE